MKWRFLGQGWAAIALAAAAVFVPGLPSQPIAALADPLPTPSTTSADLLTDVEAQPEGTEELPIENLTADQIAQLEAIFQIYQPQIDAAALDYITAVEIFGDLLVPTTADLALTNARNNVVATGQVIDDLIFQRNLAMRGVLTLEQRQVINDFVRDWYGLGAGNPTAAFPENLLGQDIETALSSLTADGWTVSVRTPGWIALDREAQKLALDVNRAGQVEVARLY